MDFQIILLPERDYWSWVRACKDYVMTYGANLTSDRETAGRYMAPMQVITFPNSDRLKAEYGDLVQWVDDHHQGVRVDAIPADSPAELESVLRNRLQADDRYGQRQKPFYLLWPTQYPIITQKFGANPHIYTRFGMPGHEGLDIRALPYTDVYCCAQGTVYRVHTNPNSHAYGIHVRVRHKDGYRTVYGHLAKALVTEGEQLEAGQILGKADSTGASTAAHLHLTLKQDGATARKETKYPKDVIDPTPFMVWPESSGKTASPKPSWAAGRCLIGVHGRLGERLTEEDLQVIQRAGFEAVKLQIEEPGETISSLRSTKPNLFVVTRLSADLSSSAMAPTDFLQAVQSQAASHYQAGVRHFEIGAAPNLQLEGWNRSWRSGAEYSKWLRRVISGLREMLPEAALGFPGLDPGGALSGWRQDEWLFLEEAESVVEEMDWVGVVCYWKDEVGLNSLDGGRRFLHYRQRFPGKLLMVTEFQNPSPETTHERKLQQYRQFYRMLREQEGVAAAFAYPLAAKEGYESVALLSRSGDGRMLIDTLSERGF